MPSEIVVDLGEINGGERHFSGPDELVDWCHRELHQFEWVSKYQGLRNKLNPLRSDLTNTIKNYESSSSNDDEEATEKALSNVISTVNRVYNEGMVSSESRTGIWLLQKFEEHSDKFACGAMSYFLNVTLTDSDPFLLKGFVNAALFDQGQDLSVEVERERLNNLYSEWSAKLKESFSQFETFKDEAISNNEEIHEVINEHATEYGAFLEQAKEDKKNIEKTYDEHMKLSAPITYWSNKRDKHLAMSVFWGAVLIFVLILAVTSGFSFADSYLSGKGQEVVWHYGIVIFGALVFFWILQVIARLLISNIHLYEDAGERTTMISTYLSFMKDANVEQAEDRQIILQALFKPAQAGLLKDEAGTPYTELLRSIQSRSATG